MARGARPSGLSAGGLGGAGGFGGFGGTGGSAGCGSGGNCYGILSGPGSSVQLTSTDLEASMPGFGGFGVLPGANGQALPFLQL